MKAAVALLSIVVLILIALLLDCMGHSTDFERSLPTVPDQPRADYHKPHADFSGMTFTVTDAQWIDYFGDVPRVTFQVANPTGEAIDYVDISVPFFDENGVEIGRDRKILHPLQSKDAIEIRAHCYGCEPRQTRGWSYAVDVKLQMGGAQTRLFRGEIPDR
ncbi:FxLYD domain-containing protein [Thiocapsa roseopersicina]|uniref:Uncharacterized protein n=1 Tax=Thiocapsa roseopersicina TaxID=1058 RepID=A0A1H3DRG1_THIRO|nr:FxLYD domain-containing protein [Thiocapsa roseopersicina]SDX69122.1 hypothetical protein SAMN05421783_1571 [Thiocapsa roseopersicina]